MSWYSLVNIKWKDSLIIDLVYLANVVWCSIIMTRSLGTKPVIKSAKEKWLTAVGWEVGII